MKRWITVLSAMLLMSTLATAQGELVSISELRAQVEQMGRWTQTYEVNGRTIDVDIPIIVPEVEDIPILKVRIIQPMTQERMKQSGGTIRVKEKRDDTFAMIEDRAMLTALGQEPGTIEYALDSGRGDITLVYDHSPTVQRNTQKLWANEQRYYPEELDAETCYAEENPMSLADAERYLNEMIGYFYGDEVEPVAVDYISVRERARRKEKTKDSYPMGTYEIHFMQQIGGVPILGLPRHLYDMWVLSENKIYGEDFTRLGTMQWFSEIMDKRTFFLHVLMMEKTDEIPCEVFAGLETVLSMLEKEIEAGRIRNIYALRLGYICYLNPEETYAPYPAFDGTETYVLYPIWVCECEYVDSPKAVESEYAENGDFRTGTNFKKVGIDARSGKLLDPYQPTLQSYYPPENEP